MAQPAAYHRTASDARLDRWSDKMHGDAAEAACQAGAAALAGVEGTRESTGSLMVASEEVDLINVAVRAVGGSGGSGDSAPAADNAKEEALAPPLEETRGASRTMSTTTRSF